MSPLNLLPLHQDLFYYLVILRTGIMNYNGYGIRREKKAKQNTNAWETK